MLLEQQQAGRGEWLAFEAREQGREQLEIGKSAVGSGEDFVESISERKGDEYFDYKDEQKRSLDSSFAPEDGSGDGEDGEQERGPAETQVLELCRLFGPLQQGFGVDSGLQLLPVFAEDGHVFAEVKAVAKFADGGVTLGDFVARSGRQQPVRESVFAHAGAGLREQLEEAACSKEVEIGCIEAGCGFGSRSLLAVAAPAVFNARQPFTIDVDGPLGEGFLVQDRCMIGCDCGERCGWKKKPPRGDVVSVESNPRDQQRNDDEQKSQVSQRAVCPVKLCRRCFAGLLALTVFFRRRCLSR